MSPREADQYRTAWGDETWRKFRWSDLVHRALSFYSDYKSRTHLEAFSAAAAETEQPANSEKTAADRFPAPTTRPKSPLQRPRGKKAAPTPTNNKPARGKKGGAS